MLRARRASPKRPCLEVTTSGQNSVHYNWGMTTVARGVLVAIALGAYANAQATADGETVSVTDVRPLMKVAEYVTGRYGIPVAYEDLPSAAYSGGLPPESTVRFRAR